MSTYVYGATEASTWLDGNHYSVHVDQAFPADHPLVKAQPSLFNDEPFNPGARDQAPVVEQATQAPGETRRGPGRPRKS